MVQLCNHQQHLHPVGRVIIHMMVGLSPIAETLPLIYDNPPIKKIGGAMNHKNMSDNYSRYSIQVSLVNTAALHMRPAAVLVKIASNFESDVIIEYNGMKASCKSLLEIIMLGIRYMANFTVSAVGKDAQNAIKAVKDFFDKLLNDKTYEDAVHDGKA